MEQMTHLEKFVHVKDHDYDEAHLRFKEAVKNALRPHAADDILHISTTHAVDEGTHYLTATIVYRFRDPHASDVEPC